MPFDAIAHFRQNLPYRPYAMREKPGRCSPIAAAKAAGVPYIQVNQPAMVHWMVFDLDHEFAHWQWRDAEVPPPTLIVGAPDKATAHYYYGLKAPVCRSDAARAKPLRYLAAIEAGLREALEADPGYTGLIAKNPLWSGWAAHQLGEPYDLSDFSHWALPWDQCRRPAVEQFGLGRNCTLFDMPARVGIPRAAQASQP